MARQIRIFYLLIYYLFVHVFICAFDDVVGRKDTFIVKLDNNATHNIDSVFNEQDKQFYINKFIMN